MPPYYEPKYGFGIRHDPVEGRVMDVYLYKHADGYLTGASVKMDVALNDKPVGQTAAKTYLALEVEPGTHRLSSRAENESVLDVTAEAGRSYFVWQEVKMGVLYARNKLQLVDEAKGRDDVGECRLIESQ